MDKKFKEQAMIVIAGYLCPTPNGKELYAELETEVRKLVRRREAKLRRNLKSAYLGFCEGPI